MIDESVYEKIPLEGLVPLAEAGNPAARFELGKRYANGKGVPRSWEVSAG